MASIAKYLNYKKSSEEADIITRLEACLAEGVDHCEPIHTRVEENNKYIRGFQWSEQDIERQKEKDRPALPLNSLVKVVNAVANREIMDRIVPRAYGRSEEDHGIAEVMDEAMRWQRDMAETEHEESMAFRNAAGSGWGVMHKWWDQMGLEGAGIIRDEEIPIWYMLWDSRSRKQNIIDRRWHMCGKYVPLSEAKELFGDVSKQSKSLFKRIENDDMFGRDREPYSGPNVSGGRWGWSDVSKGQYFLRSEQELFIIEYEWKDSKKVWRVSFPVRLEELQAFIAGESPSIDIGRMDEQQQPLPVTQEELASLDESARQNLIGAVLASRKLIVVDDKTYFDAIAAAYQDLTGQEFTSFHKNLKETFRFALVTDGVVLDKGIRPFGYTYEFITGFPYEQKSGMDFFGMCDIAKGPQDMKNVFLSNMLTLYMTSPKGGLLVEESALDNPQKFVNQYAKPSGITFVPDGFLASNRFLRLEGMQFPPMLPELLQLTSAAVQEEFGLSSIETGSQSDLRRITTNVANAARQASNTILAILFDGLRRYRRRWGMLNMKFIQAMYNPDEVRRIIGEEKGQLLTGMEDWPEINKFDIKIDEAPTTVSEQLETMDQLTRTGTLEKWVDSGKMLFEDAIDLMVNLPKSVRERIKRNSRSLQELQGQMQGLQSQLEQAQQKEVMWQVFLKTVPEGQMVLQQFEAMYMLMQQVQAETQQSQEGQQPAG